MLDGIYRSLKPGGFFVSIDPLFYNPVIWAYRLLATKVRSEDESPLRYRDLCLVRARFKDAKHREFWILALALFLKYLPD